MAYFDYGGDLPSEYLGFEATKASSDEQQGRVSFDETAGSSDEQHNILSSKETSGSSGEQQGRLSYEEAAGSSNEELDRISSEETAGSSDEQQNILRAEETARSSDEQQDRISSKETVGSTEEQQDIITCEETAESSDKQQDILSFLNFFESFLHSENLERYADASTRTLFPSLSTKRILQKQLEHNKVVCVLIENDHLNVSFAISLFQQKFSLKTIKVVILWKSFAIPLLAKNCEYQRQVSIDTVWLTQEKERPLSLLQSAQDHFHQKVIYHGVVLATLGTILSSA